MIVQRLPVVSAGDPIVSAVLTTPEALLERGTYEVNTEDRDRRVLDMDLIDATFLPPGGLFAIDIKGERKGGLLTKFSGETSFGNSVSSSTSVTVETIA